MSTPSNGSTGKLNTKQTLLQKEVSYVVRNNTNDMLDISMSTDSIFILPTIMYMLYLVISEGHIS